MLPRQLLLAILATLASAQDTITSSPSSVYTAPPNSPTLSLFVPGADSQQLLASVVAVKDTTTTFVLNCPPGASSDSCGFADGLSYTLTGTTAIDAYLASAGVYTASVHCSYEVSKSGICTGSYVEPLGLDTAVGSVVSFTSGVTSETIPADQITLMPVTVTSGQDLLAAATTTGSGTSKGASASKTGTGAATTQTGGAGRVGVEAFGLGVAVIAAML